MSKSSDHDRAHKNVVRRRSGAPDGPSRVSAGPASTMKAALARVMVRGVGTNATAALSYSDMLGELELEDCIAALNEQTRKVHEGSLSTLEATLVAQTVTLNAMFTQLAVTASRLDVVDHIDRVTRLALKAQSQCRATVETLALMKSPPLVITRQANFSQGPQQVNNAAPSTVGRDVPVSCARNLRSEQNELLESNGKQLDTGASGASVACHQALAPVGVLNRASHK